MITQTLEWHRFGDMEPKAWRYCLREYGGKYGPERVLFTEDGNWICKRYSIRPEDDDLWAYWSEPKEEK